MPSLKWTAMTPAQRLTSGLCPECGADFSEEDAQHHLDNHWDPRMLNAQPDSQANVRAKMLRGYIKDHPASEHPAGAQRTEGQPRGRAARTDED